MTPRKGAFCNRLFELKLAAFCVVQWWYRADRGRKSYILYSEVTASPLERVSNILTTPNEGQGERWLGARKDLERMESPRHVPVQKRNLMPFPYKLPFIEGP